MMRGWRRVTAFAVMEMILCPPPIAADDPGKPANGTGDAAEDGEAGAGGDGGMAEAGMDGTPGTAWKPSGAGGGPYGGESPGM